MLQDESRLPPGSPNISAPSWRSPCPLPGCRAGTEGPQRRKTPQNPWSPVAVGHLEHPGEGKGTRTSDPTLQRGQSPPGAGTCTTPRPDPIGCRSLPDIPLRGFPWGISLALTQHRHNVPVPARRSPCAGDCALPEPQQPHISPQLGFTLALGPLPGVPGAEFGKVWVPAPWRESQETTNLPSLHPHQI